MHFNDFDATIVGGGLAGTLSAIALQKQGLKTVVVERDGFERLRTGAWISPASARLFAELGVDDILRSRALASPAMRVLCGRTGRSRVWSYDDKADAQQAQSAWHVARADLDLALAHRARDLGATVWANTRALDAVELAHGHAVITVRDAAAQTHTVQSRLLVDASGEQRWLAARNNVISIRENSEGSAFESHLLNMQPTAGAPAGAAEFVSFAHGSIWLLPLRAGVYSVGASITRVWAEQRKPAEDNESFFQRTLRDAAILKGTVTNAQAVGPAVLRHPFGVKLERQHGPGWIAVGTCAGSCDPALAMDSSVALLSVSALNTHAERVFAGEGHGEQIEQAARFCTEISQHIARSSLTDALLLAELTRGQRASARALLRMELSGDGHLSARDFLQTVGKP
jgi:flavin-dependent dehydrogenase